MKSDDHKTVWAHSGVSVPPCDSPSEMKHPQLVGFMQFLKSRSFSVRSLSTSGHLSDKFLESVCVCVLFTYINSKS